MEKPIHPSRSQEGLRRSRFTRGGLDSRPQDWERRVRKLRVGVVDLAHKGPTRALYARVMHANLAAIMPQVVAVWCQEQGHQVEFVCYTGLEDLERELPSDCDLVFLCSFTQSAQLAYALSNYFRSKGALTAIGGPHAIDALVNYLKADWTHKNQWELKRFFQTVMNGLKKTGDPRAVERGINALKAQLKIDDVSLRSAATEVLQKIDEHSAVDS